MERRFFNSTQFRLHPSERGWVTLWRHLPLAMGLSSSSFMARSIGDIPELMVHQLTPFTAYRYLESIQAGKEREYTILPNGMNH